MPTTYANINATTDVNQLGDGLVIDAYDRAVRWELTDMPIWRQFVDVHPIDPTNKFRVVHIKKHNYFPAGTRDLDEVADGAAISAPETTDIPITLVERGMRTERTFLLDQVAYVEVDPAIAHQLAKDAADTHDLLVRDALLTSTNFAYSATGVYTTGGTVDSVDGATDSFLTAAIIRRAKRDLVRRNVAPVRGQDYVGLISPEQVTDLKEDVGANAWAEPHVNVDTAEIYNGEVGRYEGVTFMETNRIAEATNAHVTPTDVQKAVFLGREALAEASQKDISTGLSPVLDAYNRHRGIFWHSLNGYALFRDEAVQIVATNYSA